MRPRFFAALRRATAVCALLVLAPLAGSCNDEADRFETITKLRAIGVAIEPVVLALPPPPADPFAVTQTASLTAIVATPKGQEVSFEPLLDAAASLAIPLPLRLDTEAVLPPEEFAKFTLHKIRAVFDRPETGGIPSAAELPPALQTLIANASQAGYIPFRFGLRATSGAEEEKIVGNVVVYYADRKPDYQALKVSIGAPEANAVAGAGPLRALIDNPNGENVRVGWYVSSGKVKNRKARDTDWEKPDSGPQTIMVTVRGLKSGSFAYAAIDVTVP